MATLIVTNTNSSGAGSLADAVAQANATVAADTIVFAKALASQTVNLSGDLVLTNTVTINGDTNADGDADITLVVAAGQIVNNAGNTAILSSLTLTGGAANINMATADMASAIFNDGELTLNYCSVTNNVISANGASNESGASAATIINTGTLNLLNSAFASNSNVGGQGANSTDAMGGVGGTAATILDTGKVYMDRTAFIGNTAQGGNGGHGGSVVQTGYYTYTVGYNGGDGGSASGVLLDLAGGTISDSSHTEGTYGGTGNSGIGGQGGAAGYVTASNGNNGQGGTGPVYGPGIYGSLEDIPIGTMGADTVNIAQFRSFSSLGGNDTISAQYGCSIYSGAGNDRVTVRGSVSEFGNPLGSRVNGGLGNDTIICLDVFGGGGYNGGGGIDTIDFSANSFLYGTIDLGAADFRVNDSGFLGFENAIGSQGGELIIGGRSANHLAGSGGNDVIEGGRGADFLEGNAGVDTVSYEHARGGVSINLQLAKGSGSDATGDILFSFENVIGSAHDDILKGNSDFNELAAGAGDDLLNGSGGNDILTGGSGADVFVLSSKGKSADTITDFSTVDDTLQISAADFGRGLVAGELARSRFVSNTTGLAGDANDRFIYRTDTGELFFDDNGDASGGNRLIATFTDKPVLTFLEFVIV